jgi:hypothetical protein
VTGIETTGGQDVDATHGRTFAILLAAWIAGWSVAAGCGSKDIRQEIVATVNGDDIRVVDLREPLGSPAGAFAVAYVPVEKKKEALDRLVAVRLLAQDARSRGLDNTPEFREMVRQNDPGIRIAALFRKEVAAKLSVEEKEVKAETDRIREANKGIPEADATARATKAVADGKIRKIQEDLLAAARKETGATVDQAALDRIAKGEAVPDNAVLASAGEEKILYGDLKKFFPAAGGAQGQADPARNPAVILGVVNRELGMRTLAAYAKKQGIDASEWYRSARQDMERYILSSLDADRVAPKDVPVTGKEIEAAYAEHAQMLTRDGKKVPLPAVREQLRAFIQNEKRRKAVEEFVADLRKKAKITVNEAVLPKV